MNKCETDQPSGMPGDDARDIAIGNVVVAMKRREDDSFLNACPACATQVRPDRGVRVPRSGHAIALAGMAVAVDDHIANFLFREEAWRRSRTCVAVVRNQIEV